MIFFKRCNVIGVCVRQPSNNTYKIFRIVAFLKLLQKSDLWFRQSSRATNNLTHNLTSSYLSFPQTYFFIPTT